MHQHPTKLQFDQACGNSKKSTATVPVYLKGEKGDGFYVLVAVNTQEEYILNIMNAKTNELLFTTPNLIGPPGSDSGGVAVEVDPFYTADKPSIAVKADVTSAVSLANNYTRTYVDESIAHLHLPGALIWEEAVPTVADLPQNLTPNDVGNLYPVTENGYLYVWNGTKFVQANGVTDLSNYYTKAQIDSSYASLSLLRSVQESVATLADRLAPIELWVAQNRDNPVLTAPEVFTYGTDNYPFTLAYEPKIITEVLALNGTTEFHYLQEGDYSITGQSLTVSSPTLTEGMKVKIVYAR